MDDRIKNSIEGILALSREAELTLRDRSAELCERSYSADSITAEIARWITENFTFSMQRHDSLSSLISTKSGNCASLTALFMGMARSAGLETRLVREVNVQPIDERRDTDARKAGSCLFGLQHNDHLWLEFMNDDDWIPVDPSLGIIGNEQWVRTRLIEGRESAYGMVAPFAIAAYRMQSTGDIFCVDRTEHYLANLFPSIASEVRENPFWLLWENNIRYFSEKAGLIATLEYDLSPDRERIHTAGTAIRMLRKGSGGKGSMYRYTPAVESFDFLFSDQHDAYLRRLRADHDLEHIVAGADGELETVRRVCEWVHNLWEYNESKRPTRNDPASIIEEAARGGTFRCEEYAIVAAGCLAALGIPSRVTGCKKRNIEKDSDSPGHAVAEAWLASHGTWVLIDVQHNIVPVIDGTPLNAVEFSWCLKAGLSVMSQTAVSDGELRAYFEWIEPYLYYFDTRLDNSVDGAELDWTAQHKVMLMPIGATRPTVFGGKKPILNVRFTDSAAAFYPPLT